MAISISVVSLNAARGAIARAMLDRHDVTPSRLGDITLREHQHTAAGRLLSLIAAHGGAMLAEPVGVGKTYTALAVAQRLGQQTLIVAPAALREMWVDSLRVCGVHASVATHESLSRGVAPALSPAFVIVDEAHRLRNPSTRRYALLAELCRGAKVLLVTATPVQNRRADLAAQIALFAGRPAWQLSEDELAAYVVRDSAAGAGLRPRLDGPHSIVLATRDDCLEQLLALPTPVPAKDESVAAALLTYGLLHQWTSSRAALVASLTRRRARGLALSSAIEAGRRPTRAELAAWSHAGDSLQLAFPELVAAETLDVDAELSTLRLALDRHGDAVETLLRKLRSGADPDDERADALRRIRAKHPGERIIAFCHYAETVNVLRAKLARDAGVAALTAGGARIASGRVRRSDILEQFTVRPHGAADRSPANRIDLLITTDLLSEGLNLQEASVVVHLDLPWNPARLDQRVGRALRLGSRHGTVTVYAVEPPAAVERMLQIERRLRGKLSIAQRTIGVAGRILPSLVAPRSERGLAEEMSVVDATLTTWLRSAVPPTIARNVQVAAVKASVAGFLALVRDGGGARLVAGIGSEIGTDVAAIRRATCAASGDEADVDHERASLTLRRLSEWLAARDGESTIDFRAATAARSRRAALARVAQSLSRAPRHRRSVLAPLADAARAVATAPLAEGAERILESLIGAELPDEAWLRSIATFVSLNARERPHTHPRAGPAAVDVLILLQLAKPAL